MLKVDLSLDHGELKLNRRVMSRTVWMIELTSAGTLLLNSGGIQDRESLYVTFVEGKFLHSGYGHVVSQDGMPIRIVGTSTLKTVKS